MKFYAKVLKAEERLVFGWASMSTDSSGQQIVDSEGDAIPIDELERAAYEFVFENRPGGEMHDKIGGAILIESVVFTQRKLELLGVENVPLGWWVGFKIVDDALWDKIKSGTYAMFSIGGRATREAETDDNA